MNAKTVKGLLIEDDPDDVELFTMQMKGARWPSYQFTFESARTLEAGLVALSRGGIEIVLLDLKLPDSSGVESVRKLRSRFPDVPIVVLTGMRDEGVGLEALMNGAQDYQVKGTLEGDMLKRTISYAVERHRAQGRIVAELRRLERLKAEMKERRGMDKLKDELMSTVSHEMRNPLSIIKLTAATIEEGFKGPSKKQAEMFAVQSRNIERLEKIVGRILDLSRLESGSVPLQLQRVDAGTLIEDTVRGFQLIAKERGLSIRVEIPADLPPLRADPELVIQLLTNLLDNALRFARSRITLRAASLSDGADVKQVVMSVIDDGKGVPESRQGDLFNKFVQVDRSRKGNGYKGTGLGLAICKEIAARLEGRIWIESEEGCGAAFHFMLPRDAPPK